jgi:DNA repair protein RadC
MTRNVRTLAAQDRPREKLERLGPSGLGDNELLAVVLGSGGPGGGALDLANELLDHVDGLQGLARASKSQLGRLRGIGPARAAQVLAAVELGRRTLLRHGRERVQIASPRELAAFLMPQFSAREVEQFGVVLLDRKQRVMKTVVISVGTLDASLAHPREVFREATLAGAAALALFHNHPSGDPQPSGEDVHLTRRLVSAGEILGIDVIDHVVLADSRYYSFREAGRLESAG